MKRARTLAPETEERSGILELPSELFWAILGRLEGKELVFMSRVSKGIHSFVQEPVFLKRILLAEAEDSVEKIPETDSAISLKIKIAAAQAKLQREIGDNEGAKLTLAAARDRAKKVQNAFDKSWELKIIAQALAECGDKLSAIEVFWVALHVSTGCPDDERLSFLWTRIATALAQCGYRAMAELGFLGARTYALNIGSFDIDRIARLITLAEAQLEFGDSPGAKTTFDAAKDVALKARDAERSSQLLSRIAKARQKGGDIEGAKEGFAAAREAALKVQDGQKRCECLIGIAKAQSEVEDIAGAKKTLDLAEVAAHGMDRYAGVTDRDIWTDDLAEVFTAYGMDADVTDWNAFIQTKARCLNQIACTKAKVGDREGAKATFIAAKAAAHRISADTGWMLDLLCEIGESQAESGDILGAKETANHLKDDCTISFLGKLAITIAHSGDIGGGKEIFVKAMTADFDSDYSSFYTKELGWCRLAAALAKSGEIAWAKEAFVKSMTMTRKIDVEKVVDEFFEIAFKIAAILVQNGDMTGAKETFAEARALALKSSDHYSCGIRLINIAQALAHIGAVAEAKETCETAKALGNGIENMDQKISFLARLAEALARCGNRQSAREAFKAAITAANEMRDKFSNTEMLLKLVRVDV